MAWTRRTQISACNESSLCLIAKMGPSISTLGQRTKTRHCFSELVKMFFRSNKDYGFYVWFKVFVDNLTILELIQIDYLGNQDWWWVKNISNQPTENL